MATTRVFTIEDLEALPDDGHVYELIDGQLRRKPDVGVRHGAIQGNVTGPLWAFVKELALGEVLGSDTIYEVRRAPDRGLRPDASFVRADRLPPEDQLDKPLAVVPDLAIEVVSPNDPAADVEEKIETYRQAGVPLVWVLWPRRRVVAVYAAGKPMVEVGIGDELDGGEVLPGFRIAVADLFRVGR
jgi:Uma2 family endonuclease